MPLSLSWMPHVCVGAKLLRVVPGGQAVLSFSWTATTGSQEVCHGKAEQQQRHGQFRICWQWPDRNRSSRRTFAPDQDAFGYTHPHRETAVATALSDLGPINFDGQSRVTGTLRGSGYMSIRGRRRALLAGSGITSGSLGFAGDLQSHHALNPNSPRKSKVCRSRRPAVPLSVPV